MATFSQGFLQSLASPSYARNLYDIGRQIGQAPTAVAQMNKEDQFREIMKLGNAAIANNDPTNLARVSRQLNELGYTEEAVKFSTAARKAGQEVSKQQEKMTSEAEAERTKATQLAEATRTATQNNDTASLVALRTGSLDPGEYLKSLAKPEEKYKVVGNRVFDTLKGDFVGVGEAAETLKIGDLQKIATPDSIINYVKSGNVEDLLPITEEKEEDETKAKASALQVADNTLQTIDDALDLTGDYWRIPYDLLKFSPVGKERPLRGKVDTLKANLSFDRLQKMRDESKTGGALGNVSNIELGLLGSAVAALDPAAENFVEQLQIVRDHYESFKAGILGQKPPSDRYIENKGKLYYYDEKTGNYTDLGAI